MKFIDYIELIKLCSGHFYKDYIVAINDNSVVRFFIDDEIKHAVFVINEVDQKYGFDQTQPQTISINLNSEISLFEDHIIVEGNKFCIYKLLNHYKDFEEEIKNRFLLESI